MKSNKPGSSRDGSAPRGNEGSKPKKKIIRKTTSDDTKRPIKVGSSSVPGKDNPRDFNPNSRDDKRFDKRGDSSFNKRDDGNKFRSGSSDRPYNDRQSSDRDKPREFKSDRGADKPYEKRDDSSYPKRDEGKSFRSGGPSKPYQPREGAGPRNEKGGDFKPFKKDDKPYEKRGDSSYPKRDEGKNFRSGGSSKPYQERAGSDRDKPRDYKPRTDDKRFEKRGDGDFGPREEGKNFRPGSSSKPYQERSRSDKEKPAHFKPFNKDEKRFDKKSEGNYSNNEEGRKYGSKFKKPKGRNAEDLVSRDGSMRLNRFLAIAGIASRREADELIRTGLVMVNGKIITEMGHRVNPTDDVRYNGTRLKAEKKVYILLNKPKGFITTVEDPKARKTVMELINHQGPERFYPVGRLDRATTGLLMFTNDGDLAKKLTHPSHGAKKIYHVVLDKNLTKGDLTKITNGLELEDGLAQVDAISYVDDKAQTNIGLEIHIGKNRIVRRIFEHLGYEVTKLDRMMFAGLTKKNLQRGQWRYLTEKEVSFLQMI